MRRSFAVSVLVACQSAMLILAFRVEASAQNPSALEEASFLDDLQHRTFNFFWKTSNPNTGLVPDRWPSDSPSSVAAVGFGLTAYPVGVERGWVTREEAFRRVLKTLRFLQNAPQGTARAGMSGRRGFFYHFLSMEEGVRYRRCELSSVDTALLMAGVLFCQEYFDRDDPKEAELRQIADQLYRRVEWDWMQNPRGLITMAWRPETPGFEASAYEGYNEAMLLYLLALGSPTHAVDPEAWEEYCSTYTWREYYGHEHVNFSPLFGHQYSHVWVDFRGVPDAYMREKGADYFENSRRATLAQREYAIDNPNEWRGYGANMWGLTACDGPYNGKLPYRGERRFHTYLARGASGEGVRDDGTIAPTAAGGSVPFAPEETIAALQEMKDKYGDKLYREFGFLDAFNPTYRFQSPMPQHGKVYGNLGWVDTDYLGIDQGPILLMVENYRSELVWRIMKKSPYLQRGMSRAGFQGGWLEKIMAQSEQRPETAVVSSNGEE